VLRRPLLALLFDDLVPPSAHALTPALAPPTKISLSFTRHGRGAYTAPARSRNPLRRWHSSSEAR
jgi:hypothetical protein